MRLNTNESPFPPPEKWSRDLLAALAEVSFHRYPDRPATELRAAIAALHGVTPDEVFCANGSNEVLQCLLLAYGGPGRKAALFEPTYALHSHISRLTGTTVVEGGRTEDFRIDLEEAARAPGPRSSPRSPSCARPTTRPAGPSRRETVVGDPARRPRASSSSMRPTVSSRPGAPSACGGRPPDAPRPGRHPHLLQDVGHGRGPPRVPDRRPRGGAGLRGRGAAVPPLGPDAAGRPAGAATTPTRWRPGWRSSPRSGAGWRPRWASCRLKAGRPMPISSSSARCTTMRTRCGAACSSARCSSATAPAGTGWTAACGSPSGGPTRTTAS